MLLNDIHAECLFRTVFYKAASCCNSLLTIFHTKFLCYRNISPSREETYCEIQEQRAYQSCSHLAKEEHTITGFCRSKGFWLLVPGTICGTKPHTALQPLQQKGCCLRCCNIKTHECAESLKFTSWKIQYILGRKYDWCPLSRLFIRRTHFANFDINC